VALFEQTLSLEKKVLNAIIYVMETTCLFKTFNCAFHLAKKYITMAIFLK